MNNLHPFSTDAYRDCRLLFKKVQVGQEIEVGHNGSKLLGDEFIAYSTVTVEAVGADWVVVRRQGVSYTASFGKNEDILKLLTE